MLRSILAVAGGYVAMALVVGVATAIAVRVMLGAPTRGTMPRPTPSYLAVNLTYSAVAALLGGVVAGVIAGRSPILHAVALGVFVLAMSLLSMRTNVGAQPRWYQVTLVAGLPLITASGGLLVAVLGRGGV